MFLKTGLITKVTVVLGKILFSMSLVLYFQLFWIVFIIYLFNHFHQSVVRVAQQSEAPN